MRTLPIAFVIFLLPTLSSPVHADPATPKDWELQVLMYGWASALDLDIRTDEISTDVHVPIDDLLEGLGWAFEGATELRYRNALLMIDWVGTQVKADTDTGTRTRPFQALPVGPGGDLTFGPADVDSRSTLWIVDAKAGWRALSLPFSKLVGPEKPDDPQRFDVDLFAGGRYWNVRNELSVDVAPATVTVAGMTRELGAVDLPFIDLGDVALPGNLVTGGSRDIEDTTWWIDPIVGVRLRGDVLEKLSVFFLGDLGGFGIGSASNFTWQAFAGGSWHFADQWSLVLAYRALAVERDGSVEDTALYGPLLGVSFRY